MRGTIDPRLVDAYSRALKEMEEEAEAEKREAEFNKYAAGILQRLDILEKKIDLISNYLGVNFRDGLSLYRDRDGRNDERD